MRKYVSGSTEAPPSDGAVLSWLDLKQIASVELSSEATGHNFEQCLTPGHQGWKASQPGPQSIRLQFDQPQPIRRIHVEIVEESQERSQEFVLSYSTRDSRTSTEIVRQQWTFSPSGSTREVEDYNVDLKDVTSLELRIDPGRHDKSVFASLRLLQLA